MPSVWWVNQGQSYHLERQAQLMWAPLSNAAGQTLSHWEAMTLVRPGDIVVQYANGAIRAVSTAVTAAELAPRPEGLPTTWQVDGRRIYLDPVDAVPPIPLQDVPVDWRLAEGGPFDRRGAVKQAYLFPLSVSFADAFFDKFGNRFGGLPPVEDLDEATTAGVLPADPELRRKIERYAVDEVMRTLRLQHGDDRVREMPTNNPGHDIQVERDAAGILHVEVKGTMRPIAVFLMSDNERRFSADNSSAYELHVVFGINLGEQTHQGIAIRAGEVAETTHGLTVQRWQGRLD